MPALNRLSEKAESEMTVRFYGVTVDGTAI